MLTRRQNGIYRPLVKKAWFAHCEDTGEPPNNKSAHDAWYRQQLMDACGFYTTKQCNSAHDFEYIMAHFERLAGAGTYWQDRASVGEERRALWRLQQTMRNANVTWPYVEGVAKHMNLRLPIKDLPAKLILKLNSALYLHWQRQQKKGVSA
ncbi:MAG: hypothetical protein JXR37_09115 [Kiritimatiellae bacterium]|nr:hypothetical protein [Kiritimatiellia bacterium]